MKLLLLIAMIGLALPIATVVAQETSAAPRIALETSKGRIVLELAADKAPLTVASFVENVEAGFYDGTVFHRVIPDFMIQGGGYDGSLELKPTEKALVNEADNGLQNLRGTVAMARRGDPHSGSVQFFINLVDNDYLDFRSKSDEGWGYAVFGTVVEGMEVADAIAAVETGFVGGMQNVPTEPVVIETARVVR